eukprot:Rmarinus@m.6797
MASWAGVVAKADKPVQRPVKKETVVSFTNDDAVAPGAETAPIQTSDPTPQQLTEDKSSVASSPTVHGNKARCKVVVLDTAAFVRCARLDHLGETFYTVPGVISEVRDKQAREHLALQNITSSITVRSPGEKSMHAIREFARLTGDLANLSIVDLQVLALTHELECQLTGGAHIRTQPKKPIQHGLPETPKGGATGTEQGTPSTPEANESRGEADVAEGDACGPADDDQPVVETENAGSVSDDDQNDEKDLGEGLASNETQPVSEPASEPARGTRVEDNGAAERPSASASVEHPPGEEEEVRPMRPNFVHRSGGSDGEGEWVTPTNVREVSQRLTGQKDGAVRAGAGRVQLPVSCMTADFTMQNVLIHMGLKVLGVDGLRIKKVRRFVMRCHACLAINEPGKVFCEKCGNDALVRVSYVIDSGGNTRLFPLRKPINTRGTKYSIPKPTGGRVNNDLILTEDTFERQLSLSRRGQKKKDAACIFDDGVTHKAFHSGGPSEVRVGYGRRNPNEQHKKSGRRRRR